MSKLGDRPAFPTEGTIYYAKDGVVWKSPLERKSEDGFTITIGFPVCEMHQTVGKDAAETVAKLMNAGHAALESESTLAVEELRRRMNRYESFCAGFTTKQLEQAIEAGGLEALVDAAKDVSTQFPLLYGEPVPAWIRNLNIALRPFTKQPE